MEKNFVFLITGPAGAGKSSVSNELAKKFEKSVVIDVDFLRNMIISGRVRPWPWSEEVKIQMSLAVKNTCDLAHNFLQAGYTVIINDVARTTLLSLYKEYFSDKELKIFLLLPTVEALLKRFDERGTNDDLRKRTIELHEKFSQVKNEIDWVVIDSSNQTLEETTEQIYKSTTQ